MLCREPELAQVRYAESLRRQLPGQTLHIAEAPPYVSRPHTAHQVRNLLGINRLWLWHPLERKRTHFATALYSRRS